MSARTKEKRFAMTSIGFVGLAATLFAGVGHAGTILGPSQTAHVILADCDPDVGHCAGGPDPSAGKDAQDASDSPLYCRDGVPCP
ncbi:hypothetical protein HX744_26125 [Pseudonocardia sp. ICBG1122]|nr:hypothetical protein [Pseudonocardia pini]